VSGRITAVKGEGRGKKDLPVCWLCKKPIRGKVYYQGGQLTHPSHRECLVVIERSKDGGI
jgi:hypothetical protein